MEKKKNAPTPKRKKQESKNLRPIVSREIQKPDKKKLSPEELAKYKAEQKEIRNRQKEENYQRQVKQQEALKNGDERYLPLKDKGPVRKFIRNEVDSKRYIAEFFIPIAFALLIFTMILQSYAPDLALLATGIVYLFLFIVLIEMVIRWILLRKKLIAKFDSNAVKNGAMMYSIGRMGQMRFSRLPKVGV